MTTNPIIDIDQDLIDAALAKDPESPELFLGLIGAIGADLSAVFSLLTEALDDIGYSTHLVKFSELLSWKSGTDKDSDLYHQYKFKMQAGTSFRTQYKRGDALALAAISKVWEIRRMIAEHQGEKIEQGQPPPIIEKAAYVFHSLKHPDEIQALRDIYGKSFFLIAAYAPRETRVTNLSQKIAESHFKISTEEFRKEAEELIELDRAESGTKLGQNVQKAFPEADVFINVENRDQAKKEVERFVQLIFGHPFFTPSREEHGMFLARAAALRSADMGRQVGAVVMSDDGDILAVGCNEVPRAGGGQYWDGDEPDRRDFKIGHDSNTLMKKNLLKDTLKSLADDDLLRSDPPVDIQELVEGVFSDNTPKMKISQIQMMNLIAYFRAVHAEMSVITDAARRGISLRGNTLVCTTFPCHECARHIVAAGIYKVLYIEPYPKSLTPDLYLDSVVVDKGQSSDTHVDFMPFVGIAPRQYPYLFDASKIQRKKSDGSIASWTPKLRAFESANYYRQKEIKFLTIVKISASSTGEEQ